MRKTFALITAVGMMAALLALPAAASAKAEFTEYTATETQINGPNFDVATDWTKPIIQARFTSTFEDIATDPRASGTTEVSGKITFTEFNPSVFPPFMVGIMRGTSITHVSNNGYEGTWVGHWQGKLTGFGSFYKVVAHGTGDLAGMKMMMTYDSTRTPVIEGRLLDPHSN